MFKRKKGSGPLSTEELSDAEVRWIQDCQCGLEHEKSFVSLKCHLNLFLDKDGFWHCGGRLGNADIPYSTKYPLLLSRDHPLTPLIVTDAHKRVMHNGVRETLTDIRQKFWIVKGPSLA